MARIERFARLLAGPLALVGFFLPWADGPSVLSADQYSGFELVGFAGRLQALDLATTSTAAFWAVRLLIVGVAIAAAWHTVLAPLAPWHRVYAISGWYIVVTAVTAGAIGLWRSGIQAPPLGLGLWATSATLFLACEAPRLPLRRPAMPRPNDTAPTLADG